MADLENLLLQAAGRTGGSSQKSSNNSRKQAKRGRESAYSDGSDSQDDDDDDSDGQKYKKRKPSGSQVPLKKRFDPPEKDKKGDWGGDNNDEEEEEEEDDDYGSRESGDDSDSVPSVGSDLYKDDEDKEQLGKMSELEREMILAERGTKIDDYKLKKMARATSSKMEKARKESPPPLPHRGRSSTRSDKTAAKSALDELRAKRLRQQDSKGYNNRLRDAGGGLAVHDSTSAKHKFGAPPSPPSDLSDSGRADSDDERFPGDKKMEDDMLEDMSPSRLDSPTFEDIKQITIRRSKLVKWFMEPFFEELIGGCFVRLGVGKTRTGPKYKLCLVRNVDATDPEKHYKLEHYTTYKWLNCIWGNESSAARWQMAMVSDSPPLEKEFKEWQWEVEKGGARMPTRQEVLDKKEEILKANTFVYSAATVKQMLQEKKLASLRPTNIAAEKDRLWKEMEIAESRRDDEKMERIRLKLKDLEKMSRQLKPKDEKALRLAEMNRKNREENFKNASELKPVNTSLKAGEAGYDPFSRRWTRSRNYYVSTPGEDGNTSAANAEKPEVVNGVGSGNGVESGEAATAAALVAAADAGKLVDTSAPVDYGTTSNFLHNFELPISLAVLQKFGGPQGVHVGFMARKQMIEATTGFRVPDGDGRRHPLTLTVSDYKRRRGLL